MTDIDEGLLRYFAARQAQHAEDVTTALSRLSERELRLVKEAAVMGYVQGVRSMPGGHRATIPHDREIVVRVVDACLAFGDLYPTIADWKESEDD